MPNDMFFKQKNCGRCGQPLFSRIMSWFQDIPICLDCSNKEDKIKQALREQGKNPRDYEGCGYIPNVTT